MKYQNGDIVIVTKNSDGEEFKTLPAICKLSITTSYDYLATSIEDPEDSWYVIDEYLQDLPDNPTETPTLVKENMALLKTVTFIDHDGKETTLKRSECRHYYMKRSNTNQVRVSKVQVLQILAGLIGAL